MTTSKKTFSKAKLIEKLSARKSEPANVYLASKNPERFYIGNYSVTGTDNFIYCGNFCYMRGSTPERKASDLKMFIADIEIKLSTI